MAVVPDVSITSLAIEFVLARKTDPIADVRLC